MINEQLVANIRSHGTFRDTGEGRRRILEDIGFRIGEKAEHVIITGCTPPEGMPHVFRALRALLDHLQIDYSLLAKEFCCGWQPLGQPAVMAKNEEDIAKAKKLSQEFVIDNLRQAEALGAKSVVLFCTACEPSYTNAAAATSLEIVTYAQLLDRHYRAGSLEQEVDYFPGCYRFRRRITTEPVDLEPAARLLGKIDGLTVNYLDTKLCCYIPPHLEQLGDSLTTNTVVTICTGCYAVLRQRLPRKGDYEVKMLPEVLLEAVGPG